MAGDVARALAGVKAGRRQAVGMPPPATARGPAPRHASPIGTGRRAAVP